MGIGEFRLLFFGSDSFSVRVLSNLVRKKVVPLDVVTNNGTLLDHFSIENQIKTHRWPLREPTKIEENYDIGLVASFGHLIDLDTIRRFKNGLFNVHPSLLPRYRGSSPIQAAILDGLSETGCTIMKISEVPKFDVGDIVLQERLVIEPGEYAFELSDRLADLGANLTQKLLLDYDNLVKNSKPQSDGLRSYAKKIKPEQGLIRFKSETSIAIDRKVRAYTGYIELYTICLQGLRVRLSSMRDPTEIEGYNLERALRIHQKSLGSDSYSEVPPGAIFFHKPRQILGFKAADKKWVSFDYCTPDQKPRMSSLDFYNGYLSSFDPDETTTDT